MKIKLSILLLLLVSAINLRSQNLSNSLRIKSITIVNDTIKVDSLSIVPGSLELMDENKAKISSEDFFLDYTNSTLILIQHSEKYKGKSIHLKYRIFPIDLTKPYQHKDTSLIISNLRLNRKVDVLETEKESVFADDDKLDKNGSISRGFALGNQRDLISMSNLNLQLSGKINDEVSILAAISDNNLPIQPDGNTQQLQEFDKIYVQLFTKNSGIKLGDIELNKPAGYYMELKKQSRGLQLYSSFDLGKHKKFSLKSDLSAGMAKGKYIRSKIQGIEGNQGPYRLYGSNNETFIIILSGSEKVFIDGKLLTRGEKFDYVIDYNSAEIVFTTNQPITKDSRITIEYEYAQQYYPRFQVLQTNYLKGKNSSFWINLFTESDNKNDPLSENYDDKTKSFLSTLGDSVQFAIAPNIRQVSFENDKILYQLADSTVNGQIFDSVFKYSTNPEVAVYQLGFSYVGENQGNYKPIISNANGKVYIWMAPINGIKQGSYEPVTTYLTPKKQSLASFGGTIKTGSFGKSGFEIAISNLDVNTYSPQNNGDDKGFAMKLNFEQGILNKDTNNLILNVYANFQMADNKFKPLENFYDVEFERDWNLPQQANLFQEKRMSGGVKFRKKNFGYANLSLDYMRRQNQYTGKRALFSTKLEYKGFQIETNASILKTNDILNSSDYLKHKTILTKKFKPLTIGISEETEQNLRYFTQTDSVIKSSFKFSEYSVFIEESDSSVNQYFASYNFRKDYFPQLMDLQWNSSAQTAQAGFNLIKNKALKWKSLITYRQLEFTDSADLQVKRENFLSGRQEMNVLMANGAFNLNFFYETGSGLELKKEYVYVEVQKGQGQFTWIDYNKNNVKEIDEFELAKFSDEADHIRIFMPGNEYVRAYTTQINQSFSLQPERIWNKKTGIKGFLARFSDQFAYKLMQKTNQPEFIPEIFDAENLISRILMIRNNLSFKSKNKKWQLDYLIENNNNKSLLTNGLDTRIFKENSLRLKWKMADLVTIFNTSSLGSQILNSEFFSYKNYELKIKSNEMSVQVQPGESFYSTLKYRFSIKQNQLGIENSNLNEIKLILNQVFSTKINIQADLSFVKNNFNGESASAVAYEMLEGLKTGSNLIWSISYNQKLSKIFQLSIGYNGRSSEHNPTIHNGSLQLRANF